LHTAHADAFAWLLLELLNEGGQITLHQFRVPVHLLSVLLTTYFIAASMVCAKGIIHSGIGHATGRRQASFIIS
jgi:hypothetical protein